MWWLLLTIPAFIAIVWGWIAYDIEKELRNSRNKSKAIQPR